MNLFTRKKLTLPTPEEALPGRAEAMRVPARHFVNGNRIVAPFPDGTEIAIFGLGCFWGAERKFWQIPGVHATAVGSNATRTTSVCPVRPVQTSSYVGFGVVPPA